MIPVAVTASHGIYRRQPARRSFMTDGDTHESYMISSMGGRQTALRINHEQSEVPDPTQAWQGELSATRPYGFLLGGRRAALSGRKTPEDGVVRNRLRYERRHHPEATEGDRSRGRRPASSAA